jgi:hypothetical protein
MDSKQIFVFFCDRARQPFSLGELRESGGYVIRKGKQKRKQNRSQQANRGKDTLPSTSRFLKRFAIWRHERSIPRLSQPARIAGLESSPFIGMLDSSVSKTANSIILRQALSFANKRRLFLTQSGH